MKDILKLLGVLLVITSSGLAQIQITNGDISITNQGLFDNASQHLYVQSILNACNPASVFSQGFSTSFFATESNTNCISIPTTSTQSQTNSVAGYVVNSSGTNTAGVALFGMGIANSTNARIWGLNTLVSDKGGIASGNLYSEELDININNTASIGFGTLVAGAFTAQPTASYGWFLQQPGAGFHWPYGLFFQVGSTPDANGDLGAIHLSALSSGTGHDSQGISFVSNDPISGTHSTSLKLDQNGWLKTAAQFRALPNITTGLLPIISNLGAGLIADTNISTGTGTSKIYGVIGIAKASLDALGDKAYGGWFKANASNNTSSEVGVHTETSDPAGTQFEAAAAGTTGFSVAGNEANFATGVNSNGGGFKHKRFPAPLGGTCPTSATINSQCTSATLSWTTPFADANYTLVCTLSSPTGVPIISTYNSKQAASFTITISNVTATAANAGIDCIAIHD